MGKLARTVAGVALAVGLLAGLAFLLMGPCLLPKSWRIGPLCWLNEDTLAWQVSVHTRPPMDNIQNGCHLKGVSVTAREKPEKWTDLRPRRTDPPFDDLAADYAERALYLADLPNRRVVRYRIDALFEWHTPPDPPPEVPLSPEIVSLMGAGPSALHLLDAGGQGGVFAWTDGVTCLRAGDRPGHFIVLEQLSRDGGTVSRVPVDRTPALAALAAFAGPSSTLFLVRDRGPEAPRVSVFRQRGTGDAEVVRRRYVPAIAARFVGASRVVMVAEDPDPSAHLQMNLRVLLWDWSSDVVTQTGRLTLRSLCREPPPSISPDGTRIAYWTLEALREREDPSVQELAGVSEAPHQAALRPPQTGR